MFNVTIESFATLPPHQDSLSFSHYHRCFMSRYYVIQACSLGTLLDLCSCLILPCHITCHITRRLLPGFSDCHLRLDAICLPIVTCQVPYYRLPLQALNRGKILTKRSIPTIVPLEVRSTENDMMGNTVTSPRNELISNNSDASLRTRRLHPSVGV